VRLRPLYRPDDHSFNEHMREAPMSPFCCSQAEHLYVCKRTSEEADQVKKLLRSSILIAFALIVGSMVAVLPGYAASLKSVFRAMGRNPYWAPGIHNIYRDQHCVPPASRSADLQREAQDWANRCTFSHSGVANRGENLYWGPAGTNLDSNWAAVRWWYNEINQYNFGNPGFSQKTGHFTQVIWRDSTLIGCGRAVCGQYVYWVCRYYPPGNYLGQFPANVPPRCK
jgi:hypothetical protein